MTRHAAIALLALTAGVASQAQQGPPAFEAASIKANTSGAAATTLGFQPGGRFQATNETLVRLIGEAYADPLPVPRERVVGGPAWVYADRFDVAAVAQGDPDQETRRSMLRALLADRFQLRVRSEPRDQPVLELRIARANRQLGPALRPSAVDCARLRSASTPLPPPQSSQAPPCIMGFGFGRLSAVGMTMEQLASMGLSRAAGRPVIDRTALIGPFDWTLTWTPDNLPPRAPGTPPDQPIRVNGIDIDPDGPTLATALREQLGLRLDGGRAPIPVLIIEGVQRPTPD